MRISFTLLEMIVAIIILSILSAFAIPKFKYLLTYSKALPIIESYRVLKSNGQGIYLNLVELNGKDPAEISMNDILHIPVTYPPTVTDKNGKWILDDTSKPQRQSDLSYYIEENNKYIKYRYFRKNTTNNKKQGTVQILIRIRRKNSDIYKSIISKELGITFSGNTYREIFDLTNPE